MIDSDSSYDPARFQHWVPPGGESLDEVRRRAIDALEVMMSAHPGKEVVAVTHGAVIQSVSAHLTGAWTETSVPGNCGILVLACDNQGLLRIAPEGIRDCVSI
jgi:broad specificity phosphatase PhoE